MRSLFCSLPLALLLSACGATPLAPKFAPPATPSQAVVAKNISHVEARNERPVVVALRSDNGALCAWELTGKALWEQPVRAESVPLVVGDAVLLQEQHKITLRDLATGKPRLEIEGEGRLVGADGVGNAIALSIAYKEADGATHGEIWFVVGDSVRWKKALSQPVGVPAFVSNQVLVPWATQRLSVLSADDGTELARWNFRNLMLGQALVDRGHVYLGQHGLLRVDADLPDHQEGPIKLIQPEKRALPGQPTALRDGYSPLPAPNHASNKIKLDWRPGVEATPTVEAGLVLRFYRLAFGLAAQEDAVSWVRQFEHDLVGSSAEQGGAYLVDDHGELRYVDRTGVTRMKVALNKPLQVASVRAGSFVLDSAVREAELEKPEGSLHDQLLSAATLADDRLLPGRAFAIQRLAKTTEPSVTEELIGLCAQGGTSRNVARLSACDELAKRDGNAEDVLAGLRQKASFLEDTAAPPVGALAQAAARMQLKQAAPLILAHAEDPNTASSDLPALFRALAALEYQAALPQLERFVRLHHAEPAGSDLTQALVAAVSVLGDLRAKSVRGTLEKVAADSLTLELVRENAKAALSVLDAPPPAPVQVKQEAPRAKAKESPAPELRTDPRPHALDGEAVQKTFRPLVASIQACLAADAAKPKSARIAMIVAGDGRMEGFVVMPTSLQGCTDAILRTTRFPATRLTRQHLIHTVYAEDEPTRPDEAPTESAKAAPATRARRQ